MANPQPTKKKYNPYGKTWLRWSIWIIRMQGYKCGVCGQNGYNKYDFPYPKEWHTNWQHLTPHHILPISKGGLNGPKNLIAVCGSCHRRIHQGVIIIHG